MIDKPPGDIAHIFGTVRSADDREAEYWDELSKVERFEEVDMPLSHHYIIQLSHECWLIAHYPRVTYTDDIKKATRFDNRRAAENALTNAMSCDEYPDAFVDVLRATVI